MAKSLINWVPTPHQEVHRGVGFEIKGKEEGEVWHVTGQKLTFWALVKSWFLGHPLGVVVRRQCEPIPPDMAVFDMGKSGGLSLTRAGALPEGETLARNWKGHVPLTRETIKEHTVEDEKIGNHLSFAHSHTSSEEKE